MDKLFTLRVNTSQGLVVINAFNGHHTGRMGHQRIDIEVTLGKKINGKFLKETIFARGDTCCAVNSYTAIDSYGAKELVMGAVGIKPGDTDDEYFDTYTPVQLKFAEELGEEIDCARQDRYCDPETGDLKKKYYNR